MTETLLFARHRLGKTSERNPRTGHRGYVVVDIKVTRETGRHWTTVTHEDVTEAVRLSITGEHYAPNDRRGYPSRGGQIGGYADNPSRSSLNDIATPAPGWTLAEIAELETLWARWHLNDITAACAHMDVATLAREDDGYGGTRISTSDPRNVCPETGYRYGHSWLVDPLPADVLARVTELARDRSDALYTARGYDASGRAVR